MNEENSNPTGKPIAAALSCLFAAGALGIAVLLAWKGPALPGCGADSGCDAVSSSRWAWWGQLPVADLAVASYALLLVCAGVMIFRPVWILRMIARNIATAVFLSTVWFVVIQLLVIGHICIWCMSDHALGVLAGIFAWCAGRRRDAFPVPARDVFPAALAVLVLIGGQGLLEPQTYAITTSIGGVSVKPGPVSFMHDNLKLTPSDFPLLGAANSPHFVIEVVDYTCPHCRKMSQQIEAVQNRYGPQLAVVVFPVPLNSKCNPIVDHTDDRATNACVYALDSLAVWKANPRKFAEYHRWLMHGELPPSVDEAQEHAKDLIGADAFAAALSHPDVRGCQQAALTLYKALGGGVLPKLVVADDVINGEVASPEQLFSIIESRVNIKPR